MSNIKQYEQVYQKYADDVYRLALHLIKDKNKAKDVVQQAFTNIYKKLYKIDEKSIYSHLIIETKALAEKLCLGGDNKEGRR